MKEVFQERIAGLQELSELRKRRISESPVSQADVANHPEKNNTSYPKEMPKKLPQTKTQFKDNIAKVKVKAEPLIIGGIEHLGVIHDVCRTDDSRIYRLFGDRYIATVSLESSPPSILNMTEITDRRQLFTSHHKVRCV